MRIEGGGTLLRKMEGGKRHRHDGYQNTPRFVFSRSPFFLGVMSLKGQLLKREEEEEEEEL